MIDIRQQAIDYTEKAVRNLRRALTFNTFLPTGDERLPEYETRRKQQQEILALWEYILSCVCYPRDEAIDDVHLQMIRYKGEFEQKVLMNNNLLERLNLSDDVIAKQKEEIEELMHHRQRLENLLHEKNEDGNINQGS